MTISLKSLINIVIAVILLQIGSSFFFRLSVNHSLSKIERDLFTISEQIQKLQDKIEENDIKNQPRTIKPYIP